MLISDSYKRVVTVLNIVPTHSCIQSQKVGGDTRETYFIFSAMETFLMTFQLIFFLCVHATCRNLVVCSLIFVVGRAFLPRPLGQRMGLLEWQKKGPQKSTSLKSDEDTSSDTCHQRHF